MVRWAPGRRVRRYGGAAGTRLSEGRDVRAGRRGRRRSMGPALHAGLRARDCLKDRPCGAGRRGRRRSMGPPLHRSGSASSGAPVSSPATARGAHGPLGPRVRRDGGAADTRLPQGRDVRAGRRGRRRSLGPALHAGLRARDCLRDGMCGAGRRGRRRSMGPALRTSGRASPGAPVSSPATTRMERRCPHRPTVLRHGGAFGRRLREGRRVRRRPARTAALHGSGAPYVRARQSWSPGVLTGHRPYGAPVSSPAPAAGGHGPCASRPRGRWRADITQPPPRLPRAGETTRQSSQSTKGAV